MTLQKEIENDSRYIKLYNFGFVGLIDLMGTDQAIVQAARVSYGQGTKSVKDDRGLIRYLVRNDHTSPLEMCQVKFHIKIPIFIMRQLVRHRTASINEYSARYSIMRDEFYIPELEALKAQSTTNKQGRDGDIKLDDKNNILDIIEDTTSNCYKAYTELLGPGNKDPEDLLGMSSEYPGLSRELARMVLPVANYTELYWSTNLLNFMKMLKLRIDSHAQYEIRLLAQAMYDLTKDIFPITIEAFNDYWINGMKLSNLEVSLLKDFMQNKLNDMTNEDLEKFGFSKGEIIDLRKKWK